MRPIRQLTPTQGVTWLDEFITGLKRADLSPRTVAGYQDDLVRFLHWFQHTKGAEVQLETLRAEDIIHYRQHLGRVDKLQPATINRRLQALRRFCRWAVQHGLLKDNPAAEINLVRKVAPRQPMGLQAFEVHALLRVAGESHHGLARRNYALIQLMIQTGLRVSKVASLRVADIVLRDRSGSVRVREGKGNKAREVPLNATARRALRLYLDARGDLDENEPLFASKRGLALTIRSIQTVIAELARRARITRLKVSPHTLRRSFALNYLQHNPGKLIELANLLGHDSLDTTAIYTRPSVESLAQDLERSLLNVYG
jgi:site-specific recombinase XerD